jgi:hypothetical protein
MYAATQNEWSLLGDLGHEHDGHGASFLALAAVPNMFGMTQEKIDRILPLIRYLKMSENDQKTWPNLCEQIVSNTLESCNASVLFLVWVGDFLLFTGQPVRTTSSAADF